MEELCVLIDWLRDRDKNIKFFHLRARGRHERNWITEVRDEDGVLVQDQGSISDVFRRFYMDMFSASPCSHVEYITERVVPRVTEEMNSSLMRPYMAKEITGALHQMHPTKAPGPDDMPHIFYQKYWSMMGQVVTQAAFEVLNEGWDPTSFNSTIIALIPKVKNPTLSSEFRPISLCNVLMKLIIQFE